MSKRKISHSQQRRIKAQQALHHENVFYHDEQAENALIQGVLLAHHGKRVAVAVGDHVEQAALRQHLGLLVVGDSLVIQQSENRDAVVVAVTPRKNLLAKRDARGELKPIAANIDQVFIVIAPLPLVTTELIDSYLVALSQLSVPVYFILNKIDLLASDNNSLQETIQHYEKIGYDVLSLSARTNHGFSSLLSLLENKTSVLVGQSGVGKSSILQSLLPHHVIRVGELNEQSLLGSHTTSTAVLYELPSGGGVIDSPGIREFGLGKMSAHEIASGFKEFTDYASKCRFRNCRHRDEPNCAVRDAVNEKTISSMRYENYLKLLVSQGY